MVDAFGAEDVDGLRNVVGRPFFAGMGNSVPALGTGELEMPLVKPRLAALLGAVQADGEDVVAAGPQFAEHVHRIVRLAVPHDAGDDAAGHAVIVPGFAQSGGDSLDA